jgi:glutathione S-transferase
MLPILYSFRRCPYAIRARLALQVSATPYELREVQLRDKPAVMLAASPKGSVPVLVLPDGRVIDESWDIMQWVLQTHDPENWLGQDGAYLAAATPLVAINDGHFKQALDRYKYANRHPEHSQSDYRAAGEEFFRVLETRLQAHRYLLGDACSIADAALIPFVRQFAAVDQAWFDQAPYPKLRLWIEALIASDLFNAAMQKHAVWQHGQTPVVMHG